MSHLRQAIGHDIADESPPPLLARINSSLLSKYAGQNVRIVGKVLQNDGKMCVLEASDRGEVSDRRTIVRGAPS